MLDIIEFVNSEIRSSGYHNRLASGIILTGGGSRLAGVDVLFKERTGYDVRLGAAEGDISGESMEGTSAPELATAIGLLSIGIAESGIAPSDYSRKETREVTTPQPTPGEPTTTPKESEEEIPQAPTRKEQSQEKKKGGNFLGKMAKWFNEAVFGGDVVDDEMQ